MRRLPGSKRFQFLAISEGMRARSLLLVILHELLNKLRGNDTVRSRTDFKPILKPCHERIQSVLEH